MIPTKTRNALSQGTLIALGLIIPTCLVSLMTVFMGAGQVGPDLRGLMQIQVAMIPLATIIVLTSLYSFVVEAGWQKGVQHLWSALPQWMVFAFLVLNMLVGVGEIAFLIAARAKQQTIMWTDHVPLMCLLACSLAFLMLYARLNSQSKSRPEMSGRWP